MMTVEVGSPMGGVVFVYDEHGALVYCGERRIIIEGYRYLRLVPFVVGKPARDFSAVLGRRPIIRARPD